MNRRALAQIFAWVASAALVSACSQGAGSGTITMPESAMCAENPSCCDSSGNYNASSCTTAAGAMSTSATNQAAKSAAAVADAGNNSANGSQTASNTVGGKTTSQAATASFAPGPTGSDISGTLANAANASPGTPLNTTSGSGSGSTGTSAGSAGSGLLGSGSGTTTASVGDTTPASAGTTSVALDQGIGAAVSMGNMGRAGARGGDNGSSNPFGGLFDSLGGKTATRDPAEVKFRGEIDPLSGKPTSGTSDPEDYFTRLTANDNLFKVIERRYQKQAMSWAKPN